LCCPKWGEHENLKNKGEYGPRRLPRGAPTKGTTVMIAKTTLAFAALLLLGIGATAPAAHANGTISSCPTVIPSTATGTWTVTKDLTATGTCITIKANAVAIDLHGHTITGPGTGTGSGITDGGSCNPQGVTTRTVRSCTTQQNG